MLQNNNLPVLPPTNAARQAAYRSRMSTDQDATTSLPTNAVRQAAYRSRMSVNQSATSRAMDAAAHAIAVARTLTPYSQLPRTGKHYQPGQHVDQHQLGPMSMMCSKCGAHHWAEEAHTTKDGETAFGMCCRKGAIELPPLQSTPPSLKALLQGDTAVSSAFLRNTRKYNSSFAMASTGELLLKVSCALLDSKSKVCCLQDIICNKIHLIAHYNHCVQVWTISTASMEACTAFVLHTAHIT